MAKERFTEVALRLDSPEIERLKTLSQEVPIVTGFVEETPDVNFFNSAIYLSGGKIRHLHRKVYPPTYGIFEEKRYFGAGDEVAAFDTDLGRMAMLVCGDCWHLPLPYLAAHDGADTLLFLAASSDEGLSPTISSRKAWERMNQSYALTLSCFVVFANRAGTEGDLHFWGGSHIVLPDGNMLVQGKFGEPDLVIGEADPSMMRRQRIILPFRRDDSLDFVLHLGERIYQAKARHRDAFLTKLTEEAEQGGPP